MGLFNKLKLATAVATKDFTSGGWNGQQLPIWSMDHPLNRSGVYAGTGITSDRESIENDFEGYVFGAYKANGPVFSVITARQYVFSQAKFTYKAKQDGKLFGDTSLRILEKPWPGGTTGEMLARMEQDASLAGNSWWTAANDQGDYGRVALRKGTGQRLVRMRPDWVQIVIGSPSGDPLALNAQMLGVVYTPQMKGYGPGADDGIDRRVMLAADEIIHYSPIPDPTARFRGMSWLTPILREVEADKGATKHKGAFFDNAAVPNLAIKFSEETNLDDIEQFREEFQSKFQGNWNAYKTLFLMGGADVTPLTHDMRAMDFSNIVGKGEARIASAAGVPPSWVGFSEGLQGSALNSGNMAANRRRFADGTIRPLWEIVCASVGNLFEAPKGSDMWWSEDGIAFLREDQTDQAEIVRIEMNAVDAGIKAGFEPDSCVDAVHTRDIRKLLGKHTGLVSVQMQPPVDPDNKMEETHGQARIMQTMAQTVQALVSAGFTEESVVKAVDANDLTLLKKSPEVENWSPTGMPLRNDPTAASAPPGAAPPGKPAAAKPPAPAGVKPPAPKKPPASGTSTPGGGGNG